MAAARQHDDEEDFMGTFRWPVRLSALDGEQSADVEALVDAGAAYSAMPGGLLRKLGVEPDRRRRLRPADGRAVDTDTGWVRMTVDGESAPTVVVFGEDDAPLLLGAHALEGLGFAVDPVKKRLVPDENIMY